MSTTTPRQPRAGTGTGGNPWASGLTVFAALMMVVVGINQVFLGIAGVLEDEVYVPVSDYVYGFDLTAWGWFHLIFGVVLVGTGFAVLRGQAWARGVGIWLAVLNIVGNFVFLPYYPVWAILLIALDVAVIWGLAAVGDPTYDPDR
jgi:hypothetical protein